MLVRWKVSVERYKTSLPCEFGLKASATVEKAWKEIGIFTNDNRNFNEKES